MRIKAINILVTTLFFFALVGVARADDQSEWLEAKADLEALPFERTPEGYQKWCQQSWNILWPWAKKGNLEARAELLGDYYAYKRSMPGHGDWISIKRDLIVLLIHSAGYNYKDNRRYEGSRMMPFEILKELLDSDYPSAKEFSVCRSDSLTTACADQVIKLGLVPSFEDYAAEIDFQISRGKVSRCGGGMAFVGTTPVGLEKKND